MDGGIGASCGESAIATARSSGSLTPGRAARPDTGPGPWSWVAGGSDRRRCRGHPAQRAGSRSPASRRTD